MTDPTPPPAPRSTRPADLPTEPPGRTTYRLGAGHDGPSITCLVCGMTSYNENDIRNIYCGLCQRFHLEP